MLGDDTTVVVADLPHPDRMGWLADQFPLNDKLHCDTAFYHSPLTVNISRPNRWSFCLMVSTMPLDGQYSCNVAPFEGMVSTLQVLTGATCAAAVAAVTVDGRDWPYVSFDDQAHVLSVERLHTAPPPNASNPSAHHVCISLDPEHPTCASLPAFCGQTDGPEPACGVLIADKKGACCPVNRAGYGSASIQGSILFQFSAKLNGRRHGCEEIMGSQAVAAEVTGFIAAQYGRELGLPASKFKFLSYKCRGERFTASINVIGLKGSQSEEIMTQSTVLLRPVAIFLGLMNIKVVPLSMPPARPPSQHEFSSPPLAPSPPVYGAQPPVYGV